VVVEKVQPTGGERPEPTTIPTFREAFRHMSRRSWGITGLVSGLMLSFVVLSVMLVTGFLSFNQAGLVSLDSKMVAQRVMVELEQQSVIATVECPSVISAPVGFMFFCMAQTPEANVARVQVTIVNVIGDISWWLTSDLPVNTP
jgi:hypothetical protein